MQTCSVFNETVIPSVLVGYEMIRQISLTSFPIIVKYEYLVYITLGLVLQVLPFLALGLGVDDMFLLAHSYSSLTQRADTRYLVGIGKAKMISFVIFSYCIVICNLFLSFLPAVTRVRPRQNVHFQICEIMGYEDT